MALKATIFKTDLQISDMDRNHYRDYALTIARHPSETDRRMMVRILAFALHAQEDLAFTRGLSTDDEPDLWGKSLSDEVLLWVDLGQPDEKRIRKACGRAREVWIYTYNDRSARVWFEQLGGKLERFDNLRIIHLPETSIIQLAALAQRNMQLQCSIQDGAIWLGDLEQSIQVEPESWK
ncbi:MAG: YaeQ family protein [Pseudomonadota bacterium]